MKRFLTRHPAGAWMTRRISIALVGAVFALAAIAPLADAQSTAQRQQSVRFLLSSNGAPVALDVARMPVLRQRLTLDLQSVTVREALTAISSRGGLVLWYTDDVIAADRKVNLRASEITVAAALTDVLVDAGVDVVFNRDGSAVIVKRIATVAPVLVGVVTGRVTDATSKEAVLGVTVGVDGTRLSATTAVDGSYTIRGVPAGNRSITARRLSYVKQSQAVVVTDDGSATADFVLVRTPTSLNDVVTTATGDQRRVELGHVVGLINADSVVKEAPVTNISELLTGRVAGLQVFQAAGTVGGEVHVQIRGASSLLLGTEPIVILDGVRYTNTAARRATGMATTSIKAEPTSPLNDINPNDIASIEVVKGPSAATLYGTDAANGVLVITTKRGRQGRARWNVYATGSQTAIDTDVPGLYHGYGHKVSDGTPYAPNCTLAAVAAKSCIQDSVKIYNPLWDADLSLFQSAPRWESGASVGGGAGVLNYYFSGSYEDATGPVGMPKAAVDSLTNLRGELDDEVVHPNAMNKLNLRANIAAVLGKTLDLRLNTGYTRNATRGIAGSNGVPYVIGVANSTPTNPYASGSNSPEENYSRRSTETTDRFVANANAQWHPMPWLVARGQVGMDHSQRNHYGLLVRGESSSPNDGVVNDDRVRQLSTSADLGVTATGRLGRISTRTSAGAQYVRRLDDGLFSGGRNLPPGGTSVGEAVTKDARQTFAETVTLGSYVEEMLGLNDRLFLTGALRMDGASAFGADFNSTVYPKASVSWILSEEPFLPRVPGLNEFRLRYAFGASGQQPQPAWNKPGYVVRSVFVDGAAVNAVGVSTLGNPLLRPERVKEHEYGFDAAALRNRVNIGLTWYNRRTVDQLVSLPLAPGLESIFTNIGLTTQHGFEADVSAQLVDTKLVNWNMRYQFDAHRTKLVDLGGAAQLTSTLGGYAEGRPLGAKFSKPIVGYADTNGDGILTTAEVQLGPTFDYAGEGLPPRTQSLIAAVGFFNQRFRVSTLFERRSGYLQNNQWYNQVCQAGHCREAVVVGTPLAEQAVLVATTATSTFNWMSPADFTRLRELTFAVDVPSRVLRLLRAQSGTFNISGRNLALWSAFQGPDPEASTVRGLNSSAAWGVPLGQTWTLRVDLGY
jgi:TonB-linked SusC/RagA family outer membrane protein